MKMKPITKIYKIPAPVPAPTFTPPVREPERIAAPREPVTVGVRRA